jgi:hypothetical protein
MSVVVALPQLPTLEQPTAVTKLLVEWMGG